MLTMRRREDSWDFRFWILDCGLRTAEMRGRQGEQAMELEPFVFRHEGALVGMRAEAEVDGLVEEVNSFALRPLGREEFVVFTLDLCHNEIDRHFSRFPEEELAKINEMAPGRPLMERHDVKGSLPRGTFFRSSLHSDGDRVSVRPDVYVLQTKENADFILNIEGGVYRETSIGFSFRTPECSICKRDLRQCTHVPGRMYGDEAHGNAVCHYVLRDVLEVIEGSVVASGSQGTGFIARQNGAVKATAPERALPLARALDAARQAFHRPIELWSTPTWAEE